MGECLNEQQVLDFVSGVSRETARPAMERHLVDCADCSEWVAAVAAALSEEDGPDDLVAALASVEVFKLGPFVVDGTLGHGGMGVVFRARHEISRRPVAVKAARSKTIGAAISIRREIQILEQLSHPGVVRMLEQGVDDGMPWYAMDLVDGVTLADCLRESPIARDEAIPRALLTTLRRLALTLDHLHAMGVAHRDLSPRNVMIGSGNVPVILDFGSAARTFDAVEHVDLNAWRAGTIPYLAPESIRGDSSDGRPADLYALGCILYQALTGAPPFGGGSNQAVLNAHLSLCPAPVSERLPRIDRELDELILRLLSKHPVDRVRYPKDVADKLGELGGEDWPSAPPLIRTEYLSRPALVGRAGMLEQMLQLAVQVQRASGGKLLVSGPSGIGKSRLASEVASRARALGVTVICSACIAQVTGSGGVGPAPDSFSALLPLLREIAERARVGGRATGERLLGARGGLLSVFEPELCAIPGAEFQSPPVPLPPMAAQERLLDALLECATALANETPTLLIIDDLQWADSLTHRFIRRLTPEMLARVPLGVIATARNDDGLLLDAVVAQFDEAETPISSLDDAEVSLIICEMLMVPAAPELLAKAIVERAEGNPFFVAEYLRTALAEGLLWRDESGAWQFPGFERGRDAAGPVPLPRGVRQLVERRLSGLSSSARALSEAAAAVGRQCERQILLSSAVAAELSSGSKSDIVLALQELVTRQVFERTSADGYRFVHDQLREVVYSGTSPEHRRRLHAAIAAALDDGRPFSSLQARELAERGHHHSLAGHVAEAIRHLRAAGESALLAGATPEARTLLGRALELASTESSATVDAIGLARLCGEAAFALGDLDDASDKLITSLEQTGMRVPRTSVAWIGLLLTQAARQFFHRTGPGWIRGTKAERHPSLVERASAAGALAITYYFTGDAVALLAILLFGVNCAERASSTQTLAISYARLGYIAGLVGPARLAQHYFEQATSLGERTGDARALALTLYLRAFHHLGRGEWAETISLGGQAAQVLRELGDWQEQEVAATIVAHALYYSGHIERAEACYEEILASARRRESSQHVGWGLFLKARSQLAQRKTESALELLVKARALLITFPDRLSLSICEGLLVQALLACQRLGEAVEVCAALGPRTAGPVLSLAPCLHAYEGMMEAALVHWSRATEQESRHWRTRALEACANLGRFARMFPMGEPAHLYSLARCAGLDAKPARASRLYEEGRRAAQRLGMSKEVRIIEDDAASIRG